MKELKINDNNSGQRLDKYLIKLLPKATKSFIYKMMRKKNITLNNKKAEGMEILKPGDVIKIFFADETYNMFSGHGENSNSDKINAEDGLFIKAYKEIKGISVLFENDHIIIINKPSGILCQRDEKNNISVNEWLNGYLINKGFVADNYKPSACNRIDCNTTGIVLCAKTYKGSRYFFEVIKNHETEKYYIAICHGVIEKQLVLKGYLSKDASTNKVTVSLNGSNKDSYIETIVEPLENNGKYSLVKVKIITGKSHQIRAHLSSIGHPLAGDIKYGGKAYYGIKHQMLHAYNIILPKNKDIGIDDSNCSIVCKPDDIYLKDFKMLT